MVISIYHLNQQPVVARMAMLSDPMRKTVTVDRREQRNSRVASLRSRKERLRNAVNRDFCLKLDRVRRLDMECSLPNKRAIVAAESLHP
jgi:hypothetical protein